MDSHPGPTLAEIIASREQVAAPGDGDTAPYVPTRSYSRRGGSRSQNWEKPPSPIRKMFNMIFGMCKSINDVVHKERERRKKDTLRLKKLQEAMLPNDPPSPIGSEGQQSEPETMEQMNARYQQEDYWGQLYGSGTTSMLTLLLLTPRPLLSCLRLLSFHHLLLHMLHHLMGLMLLVLGCLTNMLVMPAKVRVGKMEDKTMRMMISSRSPRKTPLRAFLVIDNKGGEIIED